MIDLGNGVRLVTRAEWGARPARSRMSITPSFGTTCHWEGPRMGSFPHSSCATKVRVIQDFHMDGRGWQDVAYSALVCPHGYVYEGRWVGARTAANGTNDGNRRAYAVCYLGGQSDPFTPEGARAMRAALDYLDVRGGAGPGRNGHRDWKPTECPGNAIYGWVHAGGDVAPAPAPAPTPPQEDDDMPLTAAEKAEIADAVVALMASEAGAPGHPLRQALGEIVAGQLVIAREADTENKPFLAWEGSGPVYLVDGDRQTKRLVSGWANVDREVFLGALHNGVFRHTDGRDHPQPYVFDAAWLDSIDTVEPDAPAEA